MENFLINYTKDITIVKVDLPAATMRDASALWESLASDSLFEREKLIIDLSACSFIDSTFIGMIVKVFKRVNEKHGAMKLVFPQITDIESFRVIGITKILECFKSLDNAIESFNPQSAISKISIDEKVFITRLLMCGNNFFISGFQKYISPDSPTSYYLRLGFTL